MYKIIGFRTWVFSILMLIYGFGLEMFDKLSTNAIVVAGLAAGLYGVKKWKEAKNGG